MDQRGLPTTFVPGRNLVFFTYAAALADRRSLTGLIGGMCETDFSGYPDCRRDTLDALQTALNLGMARDFTIETPLMWLTKAQTWALAKGLGGEALVEIIRAEADFSALPADAEPVATRIIHACGMPEIARDIDMSRGFAQVARQALKDGAPMLFDKDTKGIAKDLLARFGSFSGVLGAPPARLAEIKRALAAVDAPVPVFAP